MNARRFGLSVIACGLIALAGCASTPTSQTVAETTAAKPELSTLAQLMADAGLADTLKGPGPYTVFAPTNDAFKAVPAATMAKLSSDKALLKSVLSYHVVPSSLPATAVKNSSVKTMEGGSVALAKAGDFVTVEDALVTQADVAATNGVVHIVDRVLMPPVKK